MAVEPTRILTARLEELGRQMVAGAYPSAPAELFCVFFAGAVHWYAIEDAAEARNFWGSQAGFVSWLDVNENLSLAYTDGTGGTIVVGGGGPIDDSDATAYFARVSDHGGSLTAGQKNAINQWFVDMKAANLFDKVLRWNLFGGPDFTSWQVPVVVNDGALTDTFTGFVDPDDFNALGPAGNGTTKYIRTGLIPTGTALASDDCAVWCYLTETFAAPFDWLFGCQGASNEVMQLYLSDLTGGLGTVNGRLGISGSVDRGAVVPNDYKGFFGASTIGGQMLVYREGEALFPTPYATSGGLPPCELYLLARNELGTAAHFGHARLGCYGITHGLSQADVITLRAITQKTMTALGRGYTPAKVTLSALGDSLTQGGYPPNLLVTVGPTGRGVRNMGIGGETSTQIKTRFLADPAGRADVTVIWAGRNNYTDQATVLADIAAIVGGLTTTKYLILTIIAGDFANEYIGQPGRAQIDALNAALQATYPGHVLDILSDLVASYDPGTPQDVIDHGHGIPPSTKRGDSLHLNNVGNGFVAGQINTQLNLKGW